MMDRMAFVKLILLSLAVWAGTLLLYFVSIVVAAAGLQRAPGSTVSIVVVILIAVEILIACLAIAFVAIRARRVFQTALWAIWTVVFAVLQFGTFAVAAFTLLLALNR